MLIRNCFVIALAHCSVGALSKGKVSTTNDGVGCVQCEPARKPGEAECAASCQCADFSGALQLNAWILKQTTNVDGVAGAIDSRMMPLDMTLDIDVHDIWSINQKSQSFFWKATYYFTWWDCRFAFNGTQATDGKRFIVPTADMVWEPHLTEETLHAGDKAASAPHDQDFHILRGNGKTTWAHTMVGMYKCKFDFTDIPYDHQHCKWTIAPSEATDTIIRFLPGSVTLPEKGLSSAEFDIDTFLISNKTIFKEIQGDEIPFSEVMVDFHLKRKEHYYIMSAIFPSIIYWLMSYGGLFVAVAAVPARAALGLIPVLIISNMQTGVRAGLPHISYSTWLDSYLTIMNVLLLANMIEYCIVHYYAGKCARLDAAFKKAKEDAEKGQQASPKPPLLYKFDHFMKDHFESAFRVASAVTYVLVNIVFFATAGP